MARITGKVVNNNPDKGYGFISADGERFRFLHSTVKDGISLSDGQKVTFIKDEIPEAERKRPEFKWRAIDIELAGTNSEGKSAGSESTKKQALVPVTSYDNPDVNNVVVTRGSLYVFWVNFIKNPVYVSCSVPLVLRDGKTDEVLLEDKTGLITIPSDGLLLHVEMRNMCATITFSAPSLKSVVFTLKFG